MASINAISPDKLSRLIGTAKCPALLDVRLEADIAAAPHTLPGALKRDAATVVEWSDEYQGRSVVVYCAHGKGVSETVAAWLRYAGAQADILDGGHDAWATAGLPLIPSTKLPPRDAQGRTVWVTRTRPKIDRIACPWLIRRFADPHAVFLFVTSAEVEAVAERVGGTPFDMEGVFWSHRDDRCTFDTMIEEWHLHTGPLQRLALIVRAADTGRLDLVPEAAGLLAASLGLSRLYADDLEQLEAGLMLYDAFYRWCRDATNETHDWPATAPKKRMRDVPA